MEETGSSRRNYINAQEQPVVCEYLVSHIFCAWMLAAIGGYWLHKARFGRLQKRLGNGTGHMEMEIVSLGKSRC